MQNYTELGRDKVQQILFRCKLLLLKSVRDCSLENSTEIKDLWLFGDCLILNLLGHGAFKG